MIDILMRKRDYNINIDIDITILRSLGETLEETILVDTLTLDF